MHERFAHPLAAVWLRCCAPSCRSGRRRERLAQRSQSTDHHAAPDLSDSRAGGAACPARPSRSKAPVPSSVRAGPTTRVQPEALPTSDALAWPIWEHELQDGIPARAEPLTPPPWRMVSAVLVDREWQLIIRKGGATEPEFHRQGGRLPGGYLIERSSLGKRNAQGRRAPRRPVVHRISMKKLNSSLLLAALLAGCRTDAALARPRWFFRAASHRRAHARQG